MHVWALYVWVCMYALRRQPTRTRERRHCAVIYFRQKVLFVTNCLPGAFAKAVIITTEAVGTPPTNANKGAQALRPARLQRLLSSRPRRSVRRRPTRIRERRHCARRVCKGCYHHDRGGRNAADHRETGSGGSPPGAFAKAVIITTEAVGTPPTNANKAAEAFRIFLNEV